MSTEAALLRTIRESPDDDTARLVYADFVEEEGDPARGEFIRVQVGLARTPEHDPAPPGTRGPRTRSTRRARGRLAGGVADGRRAHRMGVQPRVRRGGRGHHQFHAERGGGCLCRPPRPPLAGPVAQQDMSEDLLEVGRRGWFARLEAIDLAGWFQTIGELERFLVRADSARLRELDVTDRPGLEDLPAILERTPFREQLKVVRCGGGYTGAAGNLDAWDLTRAPSRPGSRNSRCRGACSPPRTSAGCWSGLLPGTHVPRRPR